MLVPGFKFKLIDHMRTLHCRDAGFNCLGIIRANSDEEVIKSASEHALHVHGVVATPEMAARLQSLIREE